MPDVLISNYPPSPLDTHKGLAALDSSRLQNSSSPVFRGMQANASSHTKQADAAELSRQSNSGTSNSISLPLSSSNELEKRRDHGLVNQRGGAKLREDRVISEEEIRNNWAKARDYQTEDLEEALKNGDLVQAKGILSRAASSGEGDGKDKILKLSPAKLFELISAPDSLPMQASEMAPENPDSGQSESEQLKNGQRRQEVDESTRSAHRGRSGSNAISPTYTNFTMRTPVAITNGVLATVDRPSISSRAFSTPAMKRKPSGKPPSLAATVNSQTKTNRPALSPIDTKELKQDPKILRRDELVASPMPPSIPLPPMSIPAYLQLELSSNKPSPLYLYRPSTHDVSYESSQVKIERLMNFFLLPPYLEQVLWFGALACFDAWLYTFTILPLRFVKALFLLGRSWCRNLLSEVRFIIGFIYIGLGRMWRRRNIESQEDTVSDVPIPNGEVPESRNISTSETGPRPKYYPYISQSEPRSSTKGGSSQTSQSQKRTLLRHRRTRSAPSSLLPTDKADILKGFLILFSCFILMYFDASMMYHSIRGQAAIKLYVIYNVLEVFDRLLSALGQDVLECLFSKETLERKPDGRSKILRPLWLFLLALGYNVIHATALFYQVITLNVAVNSYSNALLTLLMSNQFVEIKSTVFKKVEKENLFQMTCADIVERFQLWLMLIIIASRNVIETGGLSGGSGSGSAASRSSFLPHSFTMLPDWTGQIMGPFFLVLGTEMLVDWLKHAYITKFNNTKPNIYGRFLDILSKDYYSNAFSDPNLTRRLGLPVIPLSCLFIRASVQTYHMFLATHLPIPLPSPSTSLEDPLPEKTSPATTIALHHIDTLFRRALGRNAPSPSSSVTFLPSYLSSLPIFQSPYLPSTDTLLSWGTTALFFTLIFLVLLALKLLLGMLLLSYARRRYKSMKTREQESAWSDGKRVGGWGAVEVGEDRRRWIYEDDAEGVKKMRDRDKETKEREGKSGGGGKGLGNVERYTMVAKRIW